MDASVEASEPCPNCGSIDQSVALLDGWMHTRCMTCGHMFRLEPFAQWWQYYVSEGRGTAPIPYFVRNFP